MKPNFKNITKESASMPKKYYDDLKKMGKTENLEYKEFKEQTLPRQTTTPTQTSGLPTWTNNYPCLSDIGTIRKTISDNQVVNMDNNGNKQYFFRNFVYKNVLANNTKVEGTWECKNGGLFIKTDDGSQWEKSTGWVNQSGNTTNTIKKSKFTKCSEKLPIKQYCKNETIRKIQACLKMPKRYQTGNFGPITQEYLESRDQNGTLITTETIINVCGSNHPLVTNGGNTNVGTTNTGVPYSAGLNTGTATGEKQTAQSKTGYEDYTVDEIEYSKDVTKPSVASEKPEGETSTGYEGYSEEPKNKPAKSINRPPLQSVQNPAPTVNRGLSQIRPK